MIRTVIEILPHGLPSSRRIGEVAIANDGTGDWESGNYTIRVHSDDNPDGRGLHGRVTHFPRLELDAVDLLLCALLTTLPKKRVERALAIAGIRVEEGAGGG